MINQVRLRHSPKLWRARGREIQNGIRNGCAQDQTSTRQPPGLPRAAVRGLPPKDPGPTSDPRTLSRKQAVRAYIEEGLP